MILDGLACRQRTGYGDNDENQAFARVDYDSVTAGNPRVDRAYFVPANNVLTIASVQALSDVTGGGDV
jgi:hypothetical protein